MAMTDGLQHIQSVVLGLIVSFLLAKLFSIVFYSGDENISLSGANPNPNNPNGNKSAEKDKISGAEFTKKEGLVDRQNNISISDGDDDDDWEGVETTELDEAFCAANAFVAAVAGNRSSQKVSNDLRLKMYGLYKVATEGGCSVPQPSAIKITARAKWNAWHKLGAMSQEEAMQKYLDIITEIYPNWNDASTSKRRGGDNNETSSKDTRPMGPDFSSSMHEEEFKLDAIHGFAREDQMPLHRAADCDQTDVAEIPASRNTDIDLKDDNEGQTPLDYAAVCEPDETGVKNNAATGIQDDDDDDDGNSYPSDLSHSNWQSIQP